MATKKRTKKVQKQAGAKQGAGSISAGVQKALTLLKSGASTATRDGMARFGLPSDKAFGVSVGDIRRIAKELGQSHDLALALWESGWHEARMLATFVDDPEQVTPAQMDRWAGDFDSWGICDTACFCLFDRTPHAYAKIRKWSTRKEEFVKRGAFALLASVALHDKQAPDEPFIEGLALIEAAAGDDRNFVKKGVSWALRAIGGRNPRLHMLAFEVATRLAKSDASSCRWVGKDALRDLSSTATKKRVERGAKRTKSTRT